MRLNNYLNTYSCLRYLCLGLSLIIHVDHINPYWSCLGFLSVCQSGMNKTEILLGCAVKPQLRGLNQTGCSHIFKFLSFSTTSTLHELQKLSRVKIVDNSMLGRKTVLAGKPPKIIHVYKKNKRAFIGDKVLLAIMGQKKKAYIVGCVQKQKANVPRFDTNNAVLVEDNGTPTATRIRVPIPSALRGKEGDFTKILSIATKFVWSLLELVQEIDWFN